MTRSALPPVTHLATPRLTAGLDEHGWLDAATHRRVHGPLRPLPTDVLVQLVDDIQLTGRGGAGFPFGRKLRAVLESARRQQRPPVVTVNGSESEPLSFKDKVLLTRAPHLVLDGAALAADAIGASEIVVAVTDDEGAERSLRAALAERQMPVPTSVHVVPHRIVSGQSGALVNGINGKKHIPPATSQRTSDAGVKSHPTLLSNAETYAQLAIAARRGPYGYTSLGLVDEPGTVLLTVTGAAARPAVMEVPTGTPLWRVLELCHAPADAAVLTGGYEGTWINPESALRATISRAGFAAVGGTLGPGVIAPIGPDTCPLGELAQVVHFLAAGSTGQCGPCRLGLPDLARSVDLIVAGTAPTALVEAAVEAVRGRGACGHPDATARMSASALMVFAADIATHGARHGCGRPVKGQLLVPPGPADTNARLSVDWSRCDGHGLCAHVLPELVSLDANGFPALPQSPVPVWLHGQARRAVRMCPALALRLTTEGHHAA
ncbi:NADH:ubiquinone oxidoreductase, NADH-binding subunit (chain F) [Asanoa hainanensis]|uniref:NADH:ubiquinone oxidoreductase, NADH-binding subunit (Chain F) n=1 Tax=Asanoa hainanensis TaxID=560556 RepID=A0A239J2L5_9ACTN|nr:NADH-quinone oxidoreductase subunit NuoF family protein [Asanoa hainanensis]SNT00171.1 NADH:ubiquinone oxidoreductase, NADH-binding subunit (chain F) [Asanoa hainanensis]